MPVPTPCPIAPSAAERVRLKKMAYGHKTEHRLQVRAQVVLHAAYGRSNACIARESGLHLDTVRRLRGRFAQAGLPGLKDRQRYGLPASFTPLQAAEVQAPACRLPAESEVPLSRWSCPELAREAARRGITPFMSASTVRRWLAQDALKPWQHRSGTFITSPGFWLKAAWVLHLYALTWQGEQLGDDEYVISADEKTSIQAWCHCHPTSPRQGQGDARQSHLRTRRCPGLPRRPRRPRREGVRPHRRPPPLDAHPPGQSVRDLYRNANQRNRHEAEREDDLRQDWDEEQRHEVLEEQEPCRQEEQPR